MSVRKAIAAIHPRIAVVVHDLCAAALAWWIAKALRYALKPDEVVGFFAAEFPLVLLVQGLFFKWTGLYKGVWRFASLPDLWNILKASLMGSLIIGVTLFLYNRLEGVPRSILLLYPVRSCHPAGRTEAGVSVLEGQPGRPVRVPRRSSAC